MSESEENQQEFGIHTIFLKDASFEAPNSPEIFKQQVQPQISMNLNLETESLGHDLYDVTLTVTVTAKAGEKTAFLVELHQAGVFTLRGFSEENLGQMLGIYCPNLLFPYAREAAANLVMKGGFPQLLLEPVNFEALYAQHMQETQGNA